VDPAFRNWYHSLARAAMAADWLHFSVLECGERPAAFHFGFQYGGKLSWYKPSFDWEFRKESPGAVLISSLIEDAVRRGHAELDFSSGREPFKLRFSNSQTVNLNLRVFAGPMLHSAFLAGAYLRGIARRGWHRARGRRG
jgi:CelD/BcsL family acetyltransferase involved in cellulose biosynthesis